MEKDRYIIRVFSSYCSSEECKRVYEDICFTDKIDYYGKDKEIYITTDDDYTHAIILNTTTPVLKDIPKENVIGLAYEPPEYLYITKPFIDYCKKYVGKYFIGDKYILPSPFIENFSYMWYRKRPENLPITKPKLISLIFSKKNEAPGHKYRHLLVKNILNSNLPIDIYGRGCSLYNMSDSRIKGSFDDNEPYIDYKFHVCIENVVKNDYISEKFINCLTHSCIPIYIGGRNVEKYFPGVSIPLSGDIKRDMGLLTGICFYPNKYHTDIDYEKEEEKINIIKNIKKIFG